MKGIPYIPQYNFIFTFHSDPIESYVYRKLDSLLFWGKIEYKDWPEDVKKYRTGLGHTWSGISELMRIHGSLIGKRVQFGTKIESAKVIEDVKIGLIPKISEPTPEPTLLEFEAPKKREWWER